MVANVFNRPCANDDAGARRVDFDVPGVEAARHEGEEPGMHGHPRDLERGAPAVRTFDHDVGEPHREWPRGDLNLVASHHADLRSNTTAVSRAAHSRTNDVRTKSPTAKERPR